MEPLQSKLDNKMLPLVFVLVTAVSLSAPTAYFLLQWRTLHQQTGVLATRIASFVQREVHQQPLLWQYDAIKLLQHFKNYHTPKSLLCLEVWGQHRRIVRHCATSINTARSRHLLWEQRTIRRGMQQLGTVWVAMSTYPLKKNTLLLLLGFCLLGIGLGCLLFLIPSRTVGQAEAQTTALFAQLTQTQIELHTLNLDLEQQIQARTADLHHAYQQLQTKEARLRELSNQALVMQEQERRAIARELHDALGQSLTAVRLQLQLLGQRSFSSETHKTDIARILELIDHTIDEVRRAVQRLGPTVVQEHGLIRALQQLCESFAEQTRLTVRWKPQDLSRSIPWPVEQALYRMVQEALHNIAKHANAHEVLVQLDCHQDQVILQIQDDGCGLSEPFSREGRGLIGIRERCELLGGQVSISSTPQQGTQLIIQLPLDTMPSANDRFAGPTSLSQNLDESAI